MGGKPRLTQTAFIERVTHQCEGKPYDFTQTVFSSTKTKVVVSCHHHGEFRITPDKLFIGRGCPACSGRMDKDLFIKKARAKHGSRFGYDEVEYTTAETVVTILCHEHGNFKQTPKEHIRGAQCPKCLGRNRTTEEFINIARSIHKSFYDYSKTVYQNVSIPVEIICPTHGSFSQTPNAHINSKKGCARCSKNISKKETKWLDYIGVPQEFRQQRLKIDGFSRGIVVDAYDPYTRTVYEFYGDLWHGNPMLFDQTSTHRVAKSRGTYGDFYNRTMLRAQAIKNAGYNLVTIWENEWDDLVKKQL